MRYSSYKIKYSNKIKKLNLLFKLRFVIAGVAAGAVVLTTTLLAIKGNVGETTTDKTTYTVGEEIKVDSSALMNDYFIEYALVNSDQWSTSVPIHPGEYKARAVSKGGFGSTKYGDETYFKIVPAELKLPIISSSIIYGNSPTIDTSDAQKKQLKIDSVSFTYGSKFDELNPFEDKETFTEEISMKKDQVQITNKNGEDVTDCYKIVSEPKTLTVSKRDIVIDVKDESKSYDGNALEASGYEINPNYTLGFTDEIKSSNPSSITEIGSVAASMDFKIVRGEQDRSAFYNVTVNNGSLVISKRRLTISTNTIERAYNGKRISSDAESLEDRLTYEVNGDGLLPGHRIINDTFAHEGEFITSSRVDNSLNSSLFDIVDSSSNSVKDLYNLQFVVGKINLYRRDLYVHFTSASKVYDGVGVAGSYEIIGGSLASGDTANFDVQSKNSEIGSLSYGGVSIYNTDLTPNEITYLCYNVLWDSGYLSIQKRHLRIESNHINKTKYDGDYLSSSNIALSKDKLTYNITEGSLLPNHELVVNFDLEHEYIVDHRLNSFTYRIYDGSEDVTDLYYDVDTYFPSVNISRLNVTVDFDTSSSKAYTSQEITIPYTTYGDTIPSSDELYITNNTIGKGPGYENFNPSVAIMKGGVDVSNQYYNLTYCSDWVYVSPVDLTISTFIGGARDFTGTYDGYAFSKGATIASHRLSYEVTGLLPGHEVRNVQFALEGQYSPTTSSNYLTYYEIIDSSSGADVSNIYNVNVVSGSFMLNPKPLTYSINNQTKAYDGSVLTPTITGSGLVQTDQIEPISTYSANIGQYNYWTDNINIHNAVLDADVTGCYDITSTNFTLIITKRNITLRSLDIEKTYDSFGLTVGNGTNQLRCQPTSDSLPLLPGHHFSISFDREGEYNANEQGYQNTFSYSILDGVNNDVSSYYELDSIYGTIIIHKRDINIVHNSSSVVFDDEFHAGDISVTSGLQPNDELVLNTYKKVKEYSAAELYKIVRTGEGLDMKSNYNININSDQTFSIEPVHIKYYLYYNVVGDTYTKTYDGNPITIDQLKSSIVILNGDLPSGYTAEIALDPNQDLECYTQIPQEYKYNLVIKKNGLEISSSEKNNFIIEKDTSKTPSKFNIEKRLLNIDLSASFTEITTYDGYNHCDYSYGFSTPDAGDSCIIYFNEITNFTNGPKEIESSSISITDENGQDRLFCYEITTDFGTKTINKRNLNIILKPINYGEYNGSAITKDYIFNNNRYEISGDGLASNDWNINFDLGGVYKKVASCATYTIKNVRIFRYYSTEDVTQNYNITVTPSTYTIEKRQIEFQAYSFEKVFDGKEMVYADYAQYYISSGSLAPGAYESEQLTFRSDIDTYNHGTVTNEIVGYGIYEYDGGQIIDDVTDQYDVTTHNGEITIYQRVITYRITDRNFIYSGGKAKVQKDVNLDPTESSKKYDYITINNWGSDNNSSFFDSATVHGVFEYGIGEDVVETSSEYELFRANGNSYQFYGAIVVQIGSDIYRSDNQSPDDNVIFVPAGTSDDTLTYYTYRRGVTISNNDYKKIFLYGSALSGLEKLNCSSLASGDELFIGEDRWSKNKDEYALIDINGINYLDRGTYYWGAQIGDIISQDAVNDGTIRIRRLIGNVYYDVTDCYNFSFNFTNTIEFSII